MFTIVFLHREIVREKKKAADASAAVYRKQGNGGSPSPSQTVALRICDSHGDILPMPRVIFHLDALRRQCLSPAAQVCETLALRDTLQIPRLYSLSLWNCPDDTTGSFFCQLLFYSLDKCCKWIKKTDLLLLSSNKIKNSQIIHGRPIDNSGKWY